MIAEIKEMLDRQRKTWLINPDSDYCQTWDKVVFIALIFTAILTPFEVAFLKTRLDLLFWINRAVDLIFIKDMGMQFFLVYQMGPMNGNRMVRDHRKIVHHYLTT